MQKSKNPKSLRHHREHIDKRLLLQLRLFSIIFLVLLVVIALDVIRNDIGIPLVLGGLIIGLGLGLLVSRMRHVSWNEGAGKVVGRIDRIGAAILVIYLAFMLSRNWIFAHWVQGVTLTAFTLTITTGSMFGRLLGMGYLIRRTLEAWGIGAWAVDDNGAVVVNELETQEPPA